MQWFRNIFAVAPMIHRINCPDTCIPGIPWVGQLQEAGKNLYGSAQSDAWALWFITEIRYVHRQPSIPFLDGLQ